VHDGAMDILLISNKICHKLNNHFGFPKVPPGIETAPFLSV